MKNVVISLASETKRRLHIENEFKKNDLNFCFFDAVTTADVPRLLKHFHLNQIPTELKPTELACLLSHLCVFEQCIQTNNDYVAIFEDDIHLGENVHTLLMGDAWLKNNKIDILKT